MKVYTLYLYYFFLIQHFTYNNLMLNKFNFFIYLILLPLIFSKEILSFKKYTTLNLYFLFIFFYLLYYFNETSSLLNLINILVSVLFFASLAYKVSLNLSLEKFVIFHKKHLSIIFFLSCLSTTFLTFVDYPNIINYYLWETIGFNSLRFLLLSPINFGHSSANFISLILLVFFLYELLHYKNKFYNLLMVIFFFIIIFSTKSLTTVISSFLILAFSSLYLLKKNLFEISRNSVLLILFLFIVFSLKNIQSDNVLNNFNFFYEFSQNYNDTIKYNFFSGRDYLNSFLYENIIKKPILGHGNTHDIFIYGVDKFSQVAYNTPREAGSESFLIIPFKYGLIYTIVLLVYIFCTSKFNNKITYKQNLILLNIWQVIFVTVITGGYFVNYYTISGIFFLFISINYFYNNN